MLIIYRQGNVALFESTYLLLPIQNLNKYTNLSSYLKSIRFYIRISGGIKDGEFI